MSTISKQCSYLAIIALLAFGLLSFNFPNMQQIAVRVCLPAAFVFTLFAIKDIKASQCFQLLIWLYLWHIVTTITAVNTSLAISQLRRLVGCFFMAFSFYYLGKKEKLIPWLYITYLVYYLGMIYYANQNILTDEFDYTEDRLDDRILNANLVAYFSFFATYIIYIFPFIIKRKFWIKFFKVLFLLSPLWSFAVAIYTASRQVIVIQFPIVAILLYLRYLRKRSLRVQTTAVIIGLLALVMLYQRAMNIFESSLLYQRTESELVEDTRARHLRNSIRVGLENPIFGVGPGNYGVYVYRRKTFSHSTYLEVFANTGFIGLILFCAMIWLFIKRQWQRYRRTKDNMFLYFLIFSLFYALDNVFYVFHIQPWLIAFLFLVDSHSRQYYNSLILNSQTKQLTQVSHM